MKRFREEPFIMGERIEMMIRKAVPQDLDALNQLMGLAGQVSQP